MRHVLWQRGQSVKFSPLASFFLSNSNSMAGPKIPVLIDSRSQTVSAWYSHLSKRVNIMKQGETSKFRAWPIEVIGKEKTC